MVDGIDISERLTQAEYARRKKVSRQRINRLVKDGKIPLHDGKWIHAAEADQAIAAASHGSYDHNRKMLPLEIPPAPQVSASAESSVGPPPLPPSSSKPSDGQENPDPQKTDEQAVEEIYEHMKSIIFNGRKMQDVPHVEIKKLNEFIGAVQKRIEIQEHARTLIPAQEAQDRFVQAAGQVREGLLNLANRIAGATAAKALELLRTGLPPDTQTSVERLMQGKQWEDLFHRTIHQEVTEVLRALSSTHMVRQP